MRSFLLFLLTALLAFIGCGIVESLVPTPGRIALADVGGPETIPYFILIFVILFSWFHRRRALAVACFALLVVFVGALRIWDWHLYHF